MRPPPAFALVIVALAAALPSPPARAQYCNLLESRYRKVLFGTPTRSSEVPGEQSTIPSVMDEIQFVLENAGKGLRALRSNERIDYIKCPEKGLDDRSAWESRAPDLYRQNVVLDMRSVLTGSDDGGQARREIIVQYVSIPTLYTGQGRDVAATGIYSVRFPIDREGSFVETFVQPLEIDAFVATGLGVAYKDESYFDDAHSSLCLAATHLATIKERQANSLSPRQRADLEALAMFVRAEIEDTITRGLGTEQGQRITYLKESRDDFAQNPCIVDTPGTSGGPSG